MDILVLWWSPKPIKNLIEEAREFVLARRTSSTTIKRPTTKAQRSGRHQAWTTIANRPSRSMATVVLDNDQKANVLQDFNEFLHPKTARWYSNRGIPYRRGYLFHGYFFVSRSIVRFVLTMCKSSRNGKDVLVIRTGRRIWIGYLLSRPLRGIAYRGGSGSALQQSP